MPRKMSVAASHPCGFTTDRLISIQKEITAKNFVRFFFNVYDAKGDWRKWQAVPSIADADPFDRCIKCARTIDEHLSPHEGGVDEIASSKKRSRAYDDDAELQMVTRSADVADVVRVESRKRAPKSSGQITAVENRIAGFPQELPKITWSTKMYHHYATAAASTLDLCGIQTIELSANLAEGTWFGLSGSPGSNVLICRQWMRDAWDSWTQKSIKGIVLIGTPGIGKSAGLNYFLYRYLNVALTEKSPRYIAVVYPQDHDRFVFDRKTRAAAKFKNAAELQEFLDSVFDLKTQNVVFLHDVNTAVPETSARLRTVLATSPNREKFHEFVKAPGGFKEFYVPAPTDAEMEYMASSVFKNCDYSAFCVPQGRPPCMKWQDVAYYFDNVPRLVFKAGQYKSIFQSLAERISAFELSAVPTNIREPANILVNDLLLMYVPPTDSTGTEYTTYKICFRRGYVADCIAAKMERATVTVWETIMNFTNDGGTFQAVTHKFMSRFMHRFSPAYSILDKKKVFNFRSKKSELGYCEWSPQILALDMSSDVYYCPRVPNFPVIDSFTATVSKTARKITLVCFQMTVARTHDTTESALNACVLQLQQRFQIDGKQFTIVIPKTSKGTARAPGLQIRFADGKTWKLDFSIVYVLSPQNFDAFTDAEIKQAHGHVPNADMRRLWSLIKKYKCGIGRKPEAIE